VPAICSGQTVAFYLFDVAETINLQLASDVGHAAAAGALRRSR